MPFFLPRIPSGSDWIAFDKIFFFVSDNGLACKDLLNGSMVLQHKSIDSKTLLENNRKAFNGIEDAITGYTTVAHCNNLSSLGCWSKIIPWSTGTYASWNWIVDFAIILVHIFLFNGMQFNINPLHFLSALSYFIVSEAIIIHLFIGNLLFKYNCSELLFWISVLV